MQKSKTDYDVIIIGAGPAGLALAISLARQDFSILLLEKETEASIQNPVFDGRDIALTQGSIKFLSQTGILPRVPKNEMHPAHGARVLDGSSITYSLDFMATGNAKEQLGYFVSNHLIRDAAYRTAATHKNIRILYDCGTIYTQTDEQCATAVTGKNTYKASILVAADGRFSPLRRKMGIATTMKDFGRSVVVARLKHQKQHGRIAYECFGYDRTLAILPLGENMASVVITLPTSEVPDLLAQSDKDFCSDIATRFNNRLGGMAVASERFVYPLVATYAQTFVARRFALLGDAAVGMHPVTAHGYNFGLKGAAFLTSALLDARKCGLDIGGDGVLAIYNRKHRAATLPLFHGTNFLVGLYTDTRPRARILRKAILHAGNIFTPARQAITNYLADAH